MPGNHPWNFPIIQLDGAAGQWAVVMVCEREEKKKKVREKRGGRGGNYWMCINLLLKETLFPQYFPVFTVNTCGVWPQSNGWQRIFGGRGLKKILPLTWTVCIIVFFVELLPVGHNLSSCCTRSVWSRGSHSLSSKVWEHCYSNTLWKDVNHCNAHEYT